MFQYQPLDDPRGEIRLLYVQPGSFDSQIVCELKTYARSTTPRYHAISYTWGESSPTYTISVDSQMFRVQQNCLYALTQARYHLQEKCLIWIDAVCIDQQNNDEKSCQVMVMGDIFASATCVFSCIGPMTESAAHMFDTAEEMMNRNCCESEKCRYCSRNAGKCRSGLEGDHFHLLHTWLDKIVRLRFDELIVAYQDFGTNAYWKRLWVVQEISLAKEVRLLCGQRKIGLQLLVSIQKSLRDLDDPVSTALLPIIVKRGWTLSDRTLEFCTQNNAFTTMCDFMWWSGSGDLDLKDHLHRLDTMQCDDTRDRIFGLLKLIRWPEDCGAPTPDYSITPIDLAIDVLGRIGRNWRYLDQVEWLVQAVGVDIGNFSIPRSTRRSQRLVEGTDASYNKPPLSCTCDCPVMSHIATQLIMDRCAVISLGSSGISLAIIIGSKSNMNQHVELDFYNKDKSGFTIAKATGYYEASKLMIVFTSSVRAGDLLLELEVNSNPWRYAETAVPRSCLILREAREDMFEIIGSAEVYDKISVSLCELHSQRTHDAYPATESFNKQFTVNLDAEDAVAYVLSCRED